MRSAILAMVFGLLMALGGAYLADTTKLEATSGVLIVAGATIGVIGLVGIIAVSENRL